MVDADDAALRLPARLLDQSPLDAARRDDIPGPVVLSIGGNDAMEAALLGDDAARARLGDNLDTIFGRLAAALRPFSLRLDEVACVQTVYNPLHALAGNGDVPHTPDSIAPRRATRGSFNPIIREAAARAGVRVAEVSRAFYGRGAELTWVLSGDIHPSDSGHRLIAAVYADTCGWPHL